MPSAVSISRFLFQSMGSSFQSKGSSFQSIGSSFQSMGSSFQSMGSSFQSIGSSFQSIGSSFQSMGSSFQSMGSQVLGLRFWVFVLETPLHKYGIWYQGVNVVQETTKILGHRAFQLTQHKKYHVVKSLSKKQVKNYNLI